MMKVRSSYLALLALVGALRVDTVAALIPPDCNGVAFPGIRECASSTSFTNIHDRYNIRRRTHARLSEKHLSTADQERLLMGEEGLTAFIVAEMQHFVNETVTEFDKGLRFEKAWVMPLKDKLHMGLATVTKDGDNDDDVILDETYKSLSNNITADEAVDQICNITETAFRDGLNQPGLLSALGSAILFFRDFYRTPIGIAACERIGLSDYAVAHHITDMYHHRTFRGAYTKTLPASGKGEIAAALAVGLPPPVLAPEHSQSVTDKEVENNKQLEDDEEEDECLLWSPTTPGVCIHWKSEDDAWRKTRFERIQMEGTKDPRRGGSGTTR